MQSSGPDISISPSFTTYSSGTLADIAARVVQEFRLESASEFDELYGSLEEENQRHQLKSNRVAASDHHPTILEEEEEEEEVDKLDEDDDDFEFPSVSVQPISADEIFCNGQIRPVFPVFGRTDVFFPGGGVVNGGDSKANGYASRASNNNNNTRVSLRSLMREEREPAASCSSSESSDELDGVPADTYCAWRPGLAAAEPPERWSRKSGSTGSPSKRWRIRDLLLLRRSNSDGRLSSLSVGSSSGRKGKDERVSANGATPTERSSFGVGDVVPVTAAQEEGYGVVTAEAAGKLKEGAWRRSSGRQDWVGFFTNVNGLSSNLHPF